jgi:hypothetical protein
VAKPDLSDGEFQELKKLLTKYNGIFAVDSEDHGWTNNVYHCIDAGDARLIRQPPRKMPLAKQTEVSDMIDDRQRRRVIKESDSPWSSPVVLVRKKNGELRFCVDYRKLNDIMKKDSFFLPRIDDTLDTLSGAKWFSTLYLKSGYWQLGIHPDDKEKTAFSMGQGLWKFTVMPFGLCNDLATFERLMETVLRGLTYDSCLVYLDDVIVIGRAFKEHLNLRRVFQRFREARLKFNPEKCPLLQKEVRYLGHIISPEGISIDPEKLEAVREWPTPFANIAKPLTKLTEQKQSFHWTTEVENAFQTLKEALCTLLFLRTPSQDRGSSWTQMPAASGLEECSPKYRTDRSES